MKQYKKRLDFKRDMSVSEESLSSSSSPESPTPTRKQTQQLRPASKKRGMLKKNVSKSSVNLEKFKGIEDRSSSKKKPMASKKSSSTVNLKYKIFEAKQKSPNKKQRHLPEEEDEPPSSSKIEISQQSPPFQRMRTAKRPAKFKDLVLQTPKRSISSDSDSPKRQESNRIDQINFNFNRQMEVSKSSESLSSTPTESSLQSRSSEESLGEEMNPELQVIQKMEEFYDDNFECQQLWQSTNVQTDRVWKIQFDDIYDIVYVFIAKANIKNIREKSILASPASRSTIAVQNSAKPKMPRSPLNISTSSRFGNRPTPADLSHKTLSHVHASGSTAHNYMVDLEIWLQVWPVDQYLLHDQSGTTHTSGKRHRHRASTPTGSLRKLLASIRPRAERKLFCKRYETRQDLSQIELLDQIQSQYGDYCQLVQNKNRIHLLDGEQIFTTYDSIKNEFKSKPFYEPSFEGNKDLLKTFKMVLHQRAAVADHMLVFSYYQRGGPVFSNLQKSPVVQTEGKSRFAPSHMLSHNSRMWASEKSNNQASRKRQKIGLKILNYRTYFNPVPGEAEKRPPPLIEHFVSFEEDGLQAYYENEKHRSLKPIFIQRIQDSNFYILLFPTGLLMHVSSNQLTIQAKIQLHLKRDETIIDVCYCIQSDMKKHCLWLMDEKYQVWKCRNEQNPSSCNWTTTKVSMLDTLTYKRFFKPAMTYENFKDTSVLRDLKCFKRIIQDEDTLQEYHMAFNGTATKALVLKQPQVNYNKAHLVYEGEDDIQSSQTRKQQSIDQMRNSMSIARILLDRSKLKLFLIFKAMPMIMQPMQFVEKKVEEPKMQKKRLSIRAKELKFNILKELSQQNSDGGLLRRKNEKIENFEEFLRSKREVESIYFLGKVPKHQLGTIPTVIDIKRKTGMSQARLPIYQFLIRRRRVLELLYTNGYQYFLEPVPLSEVKAPLLISSEQLNFQKSLLIVYYSLPSQQTIVKTFQRCTTTGKFKNFEDIHLINQLQGRKQLNGIHIEKGQIFKEIQVQLIKERHTSNTHRLKDCKIYNSAFSVNITIPDQLCHKEILDQRYGPERIQQSVDGKIILIGRLLIKLGDNLDRIINMGCVVFQPEVESGAYKFLSLDDSASRREIIDTLKRNRNHVVPFNAQPSPMMPIDDTHNFYLVHQAEQLGYETSLVRMSSDTLDCTIVYQSKFKIIRASYFEVNHDSTRGDISTSYGTTPPGTVQVKFNQIFQNPKEASKSHEPPKSPMLRQKSSHRQSITMYIKKMKKYTIYFSLVMHCKHHLGIEIISETTRHQPNPQQSEALSSILQPDKSLDSVDEHGFFFPEAAQQTVSEDANTSILAKKQPIWSRFKKILRIQPKVVEHEVYQTCNLLNQFLIHSKTENQSSVQVEWVNRDKLVLFSFSEFFLLNLKNGDLTQTRNHIQYGVQILNTQLFVSQVKRKEDSAQIGPSDTSVEQSNSQMIQAQQSIQRMSLASLRSFSEIHSFKTASDYSKRLLFFTPAEELNGGNIFSKVSNYYSVMHPYLEIIDHQFIQVMNWNVQNIAVASDPLIITIGNHRHRLEAQTEEKELQIRRQKMFETDNFHGASTHIHMYQHDIQGMNAIDYAFQKNAIYCIKAFVETLLILPDEIQFRNCFDKALLLMITRGMDVKQLVNSQLFYPKIWTKLSIFSSTKDPLIVPYNKDIEDLQHENPINLFEDTETVEAKSKKQFEQYQLVKDDQLEMQFNYLYIREIQGEDKLELMRTLKECEDIELFEQESIQMIIDFKWNTYGRTFFFYKFIIYTIFLVFYYMDIESLDSTGRAKGAYFVVCKAVCFFIQILFLFYEVVQMLIDGREYFSDQWNYLELIGIFMYAWGALEDIYEDEVSDLTRIVLSISIIFTLAKIVYLIRVFRQLNFLVTMLITVVNEIQYFMILFSIFLLTFAESFHVVQVDMSAYGRTPPILAYVVSVLRCAMGDFSIIHYQMGFDIVDRPEIEGDGRYRFSRTIMLFTFMIFFVTVFFIFIIFMNFLIAVISESYSKVIQNKEAFDYQQRATMINEREGYFTKKHLTNDEYFPNIIIVRKQKQNSDNFKNNWQSYLSTIKNYVKNSAQKLQDIIQRKQIESLENFNNSIKILEMDIQLLGKDMEKLHAVVREINRNDPYPEPDSNLGSKNIINSYHSSSSSIELHSGDLPHESMSEHDKSDILPSRTEIERMSKSHKQEVGSSSESFMHQISFQKFKGSPPQIAQELKIAAKAHEAMQGQASAKSPLDPKKLVMDPAINILMSQGDEESQPRTKVTSCFENIPMVLELPKEVESSLQSGNNMVTPPETVSKVPKRRHPLGQNQASLSSSHSELSRDEKGSQGLAQALFIETTMGRPMENKDSSDFSALKNNSNQNVIDSLPNSRKESQTLAGQPSSPIHKVKQGSNENKREGRKTERSISSSKVSEKEEQPKIQIRDVTPANQIEQEQEPNSPTSSSQSEDKGTIPTTPATQFSLKTIEMPNASKILQSQQTLLTYMQKMETSLGKRMDEMMSENREMRLAIHQISEQSKESTGAIKGSLDYTEQYCKLTNTINKENHTLTQTLVQDLTDRLEKLKKKWKVPPLSIPQDEKSIEKFLKSHPKADYNLASLAENINFYHSGSSLPPSRIDPSSVIDQRYKPLQMSDMPQLAFENYLKRIEPNKVFPESKLNRKNLMKRIKEIANLKKGLLQEEPPAQTLHIRFPLSTGQNTQLNSPTGSSDRPPGNSILNNFLRTQQNSQASLEGLPKAIPSQRVGRKRGKNNPLILARSTESTPERQVMKTQRPNLQSANPQRQTKRKKKLVRRTEPENSITRQSHGSQTNIVLTTSAEQVQPTSQNQSQTRQQSQATSRPERKKKRKMPATGVPKE